MKKTLLLAITLLLAVGVVLGLTGCKFGGGDDPANTKSYTLNSADFVSDLVYGESLNLSSLKLVETSGETVTVTADMVTGLDTSTVGDKELTISYNDQVFTVKYSVKYRVVFVVEGVETVQLVTSASEVKLPTPPQVAGKQFEKWSKEIPNVLTENLRIDAIYRTLSTVTETAYTWTGKGIINLDGYVPAGTAVTCTVTDADGATLSSIATLDSAANKINYDLGENSSVVISISGDGIVAKSWKVEKTTTPSVSIANGEAVGVLLAKERISEKITVTGSPVSFKYVVTAENANLNATELGGFLIVDVLKVGITEVTVKAVNATNEAEFIELKQHVVIAPNDGAFVITNDATEYGIEDIWTVGRHGADKLNALVAVGGSAADIGANFNVSFITSSESVTVSADGKITLANVTSDPEIVEIRAVLSYGDVKFTSAPMKVRCVFDGVNVFSYSDLYNETQRPSPRPVVLQTNIKDDFSATNFTWMTSTYDLQYYHNIGATDDQMKIKVLMHIKNDVYGNGFEINAHNATLGTLDSTGSPTKDTLFWGPLNFVAMAQGGGAISVKGQDNIVFAVYENVTLNNVILKSCDLDVAPGEDTVDLTDLNFAGTTVEILGDNVNIEYCRLMNGRTVLRAFGDINDSEKVINLTVKNTLLKGSREFTARLGSNRFVYDPNDASPLLPGDAGSDHETKRSYNKLTAEQKAAYDEKYINTFVTFENCVFEDAGIFSIGLDAHFAGEALKDGSDFLSGALKGWKDLAKTSYGVKLTFEGDVRLYSWKPLEDIDSSTLMENNLSSNDTSNEMFLNMEFNVKMLVKNAAKLENGKYSNILDNVNGVDYVHAGIAFFGGGKNYSVFENKLDGSFDSGLTEYNVALGELTDDNGRNQGYLEAAAGKTPFYFVIYSTDNDFRYEDQLTIENKYDVLRK